MSSYIFPRTDHFSLLKMDPYFYEEVEENILLGFYKIFKERNRRGLEWKIFYRISKENSITFEELVYCIRCKRVLNFDDQYPEYLKSHACFTEEFSNGDYYEDSDNEENQAANTIQIDRDTNRSRKRLLSDEIEHKILEGEYSLIKKTNARSQVWSLFSWFSDKTGTIVNDWVYCKQCKHVIKNNPSCTSNLLRHRCFLKWKSEQSSRKTLMEIEIDANEQPDQNKNEEISIEQERPIAIEEKTSLDFGMKLIRKSIEENIQSGFYKLKSNQESSNSIWTKFDLISRDDDSVVKEMVCCRKCKKVFNYREKVNNLNLRRHKCLNAFKKEQAKM